jgi:integration host factor subunit beta
VTKSDLIENVAGKQLAWRKTHIEGVVNTIFNAMSDALVAGDRIEIRGLGSFHVKDRMPRIGRNPKTGDTVDIPAHKVPIFTAGKHLRSHVRAL